MNNSNLFFVIFSTLMLVGMSAIVGMYIRNKIWNSSKKPITGLDYGKVWASYVAFVIPLSQIHQFFRKEFIDAFASLVISLVIFPVVGFILGFAYGAFKSLTGSKSKIEEFAEISNASTLKPIAISSRGLLTNLPTKKLAGFFILLLLAVGVASYYLGSNSSRKSDDLDGWLVFGKSGSSTLDVLLYKPDSFLKEGNYRYLDKAWNFNSMELGGEVVSVIHKVRYDCQNKRWEFAESTYYSKSIEEGFLGRVTQRKKFPVGFNWTTYEMEASWAEDSLKKYQQTGDGMNLRNHNYFLLNQQLSDWVCSK